VFAGLLLPFVFITVVVLTVNVTAADDLALFARNRLAN
jgi:hypothetical protein